MGPVGTVPRVGCYIAVPLRHNTVLHGIICFHKTLTSPKRIPTPDFHTHRTTHDGKARAPHCGHRAPCRCCSTYFPYHGSPRSRARTPSSTRRYCPTLSTHRYYFEQKVRLFAAMAQCKKKKMSVVEATTSNAPHLSTKAFLRCNRSSKSGTSPRT